MHLFLFDIFISVDILCPIINALNKKKKILVYSVNPIQNFQNDALFKFVKNNNVTYRGFLPVNQNKKIIYFLLFLLKLLPNIFQKKIQFIWSFIYRNITFSDEKKIKKILLENQIKSITYEEGTPPNYIKLFLTPCKLLNIPIIKVPSGVHVVSPLNLKKDILSLCDYYIAPSFIFKKKKLFKNKKIKYFGSLRYSNFWIDKLDKLYSVKISRKKQKVKLGIFSKQQAKEHEKLQILINKLKKTDYFDIKTREKPRDLNPLKFAKFYNDELNSHQMINWADYILSARSTSVLIHAIMKKKKIFLLKYLYDEKKYSNLYKYKFIIKIDNESQITELINKKVKILNKDRIKCLKEALVNYQKDYMMLRLYNNFYSNL